MNHLCGLPCCSFRPRRPKETLCSVSLFQVYGAGIYTPGPVMSGSPLHPQIEDSWACLRCKHPARWANVGFVAFFLCGSNAESIGLVGICWFASCVGAIQVLQQVFSVATCSVSRPRRLHFKANFAPDFTGQKDHQQSNMTCFVGAASIPRVAIFCQRS